MFLRIPGERLRSVGRTEPVSRLLIGSDNSTCLRQCLSERNRVIKLYDFYSQAFRRNGFELVEARDARLCYSSKRESACLRPFMLQNITSKKGKKKRECEKHAFVPPLQAFRRNGFELVEARDAPAGRRFKLAAVPFSKNITFGPDGEPAFRNDVQFRASLQF